MSIKRLLIAAAIATAATLAVAPAWAEPQQPQNPDEDCDDLMGELKELNDTLLQNRTQVKTPLAVCGAIGQLLGVAKASTQVADECYDDEKKRQDLVASLEKVTKDLDGQLASMCK